MEAWLVRGAGAVTLGFALFHVYLPKMMEWKSDLKALGIGNQKVVPTLNIAVTYSLVLMGLLSVLATTELLAGGLGVWLLWGMAGFWAVRTWAQVFIFGFEWKPSYGLAVTFLAVTVAYGVAAAGVL